MDYYHDFHMEEPAPMEPLDGDEELFFEFGDQDIRTLPEVVPTRPESRHQ